MSLLRFYEREEKKVRFSSTRVTIICVFILQYCYHHNSRRRETTQVIYSCNFFFVETRINILEGTQALPVTYVSIRKYPVFKLILSISLIPRFLGGYPFDFRFCVVPCAAVDAANAPFATITAAPPLSTVTESPNFPAY